MALAFRWIYVVAKLLVLRFNIIFYQSIKGRGDAIGESGGEGVGQCKIIGSLTSGSMRVQGLELGFNFQGSGLGYRVCIGLMVVVYHRG